MARDKKGATRYVVKNAKLFNSRRSDFSPAYIDRSLDQLYFTSTNEKVTGTKEKRNYGAEERRYMVCRQG